MLLQSDYLLDQGFRVKVLYFASLPLYKHFLILLVLAKEVFV
jgi:hypothetical protein